MTGVTYKIYFGKVFVMFCLPIDRINFMQLLEPADYKDHAHRAGSSKSTTCRLGSHRGSSHKVLAPASTPALVPPGVG